MKAWNRKKKPKHWTKPKWSFNTILSTRRMKGIVIRPEFLMSLLLKPKYHKRKILIRKPFKIVGYNC